jgi:hypothetical protein
MIRSRDPSFDVAFGRTASIEASCFAGCAAPNGLTAAVQGNATRSNTTALCQ